MYRRPNKIEYEYFVISYSRKDGSIYYFDNLYTLQSCNIKDCIFYGYVNYGRPLYPYTYEEIILRDSVHVEYITINNIVLSRLSLYYSNTEFSDPLRRQVCLKLNTKDIKCLLMSSNSYYKLSDLEVPKGYTIPGQFRKAAKQVNIGCDINTLCLKVIEVIKVINSDVYSDEFERLFTIKQPSIERYVVNTNKKTFDIVRVNISLTDYNRANQREQIKKFRSRLFKEVIAKISNSKRFQSYNLPVNFLKLDKVTLTCDSQLNMLFVLREV